MDLGEDDHRLNQSNVTVVPPSGEYSSNGTTPSDGLTEFVDFLGNNIWVSTTIEIKYAY